MSQSKKLIPKRRFREFKIDQQWLTNKLVSMAEFSKGNGYSKNDLCECGLPILLYGRLYTQYKTVIESVDTFVKNRKDSIVFSSGNEVVVPASGETAEDIARASFIEQSGIIIGGDLNIIKPKAQIDPIFLAISLSNGKQRKELVKRAQGKTVVHIHNSDLKEVKFIFPEKKEQTQIGEFFRKLDNLIQTQQKKLHKAKILKSAYLAEMFPCDGELKPKLRFKGFSGSWSYIRLGDITKWSKGANLAKNVLNEDGKGNPVIHYADLYKFTPVIDEVIHWSDTEEGNIIPPNSLLFPMSDVTPNGLARTTTIIKENVRASGDTLIATISNDMLAEYLSYEINANCKKILPLVTGTTVRHISEDSLSTLLINNTDKIEQTKIGNFFKLLDQKIALEQRKLDKLNNIKHAYLNEMFV
ncbi:restriction endonuclease subunit S [Orbus sasakiae]|uniref:Restriction endonuclease subunit S n=1 Tax=Orbus sasakiae TaxID=1078475 RepID=A0ABP9N7Q6_9GAMM